MKFRSILFSLFILIVGFTNQLSAANCNLDVSVIATIEQKAEGLFTHTVIKGETAYSIATTYNTSVELIYKLNPNAEKGIKAGDKLQIQKMRVAKSYSNHLIEAKETLYSVSRMYNISVDDLKDANPNLAESSFSIGKTILVPSFSNANTASSAKINFAKSNKEHTVLKGETLYSIGKKYDVLVEALLNANPSLKQGSLREGMALNIPSKQIQEVRTVAKQETNNRSNAPTAKRGETVRVGMLLPFLDNNGSAQKEKLVEYYEGFLLAVRELKEKGLNAEIYTFDIGDENDTAKLESLLGTNEMNSLHLIIGGISKQQIDMLASFSEKTGIKYAIPFGSSKNIESYSSIYQLTTPHVSLYPKVTKAFKDFFKNYNPIFVTEAGSNNDKSVFTEALKIELSQANIQFKTIENSTDLQSDIKNSLNPSGNNILIPSSSSETSLRKLISSSNSINNLTITFFGYPEWQAYSQHRYSLNKYEAYIFSAFFLDEKGDEAHKFSSEFRKWYNKKIIGSYPKFAYLGYDAGLFFLSALNNFGSEFEPNISSLRVPTLQSAIRFQKVNDNGGFINNGLYFIHYNRDSDVEKIDVSK